MTFFIHTHKQKPLLIKLTLMICLNQSMLQLYQTYKKFQEKVQDGIHLDSVIDHINISKYNPLAGSSYIKLERLMHQNKNQPMNYILKA